MGWRSCSHGALSWTWWYRNQLIIVLTPLILLPLPVIIPTSESLCGYVLLLMAVYWCTACVPLHVTGMLPIVLFPLLHLLTPAEVASNYLMDSTMVLVGSVMVSMSVENVNLHKRLALGTLNLLGVQPARLMLAMLLSSWFLSAWIVNVAAVAMMLTILDSLMEEMEELAEREIISKKDENIEEIALEVICNGTSDDVTEKTEEVEETETKPENNETTPNNVVLINSPSCDSMHNLDLGTSQVQLMVSSDKDNPVHEHLKHFGIAQTLGITYSAKTGGVTVLTGSTLNIIAKDYIEMYFKKHGAESPITYTSWLVMCLPLSIIMTVLIQLWLQFFHLGGGSFVSCFKKPKHTPRDEELVKFLKKEYAALGPMRYEEYMSLLFFCILVLLFFFREPGFMTGWSSLFAEGYTSDSISAMFIAFLMFFVPTRPLWAAIDPDKKKPDTLLQWPLVHRRFPWGILFIIGGGNALGQAIYVSGLSDWLSEMMSWLDDLPPALSVFLVGLLVGYVTEVLTGEAVLATFLPFMGDISVRKGYNPLLLMLPVVFGTIFSFMLPSSGAVNAIAHGFGRVDIINMAKSGCVLTFAGAFVITLAVNTWCWAMFDLGTIPWDTDGNFSTTLSPIGSYNQSFII